MGIAAIGFLDFKIRFCQSSSVVGPYIGAYTQGLMSTPATTQISISGSPGIGDVITTAITDDQGFAVTITFAVTAVGTAAAATGLAR